MDRSRPDAASTGRRIAVALSAAWRLAWPWCTLWITASVVIFRCVVAFDHPLALLIRERTDPGRAAIWLARVPELLAGLAIAGAATLGTWRALIGRLRGAAHDAFLACLGICVALALKSELKLLFGRAAPEAWFWHQNAPLRNFHLFYAGSFPSGHMAVLGVLLPFIPASSLLLRLLWLLLSAAVGGALMVLEAHYLADIMAGALLGLTVGAACRHIART